MGLPPPPPLTELSKAAAVFNAQDVPLQPAWQAVEHESGRKYFVNQETGETTWSVAKAAGIDTKMSVGPSAIRKQGSMASTITSSPGQFTPSLSTTANSSLEDLHRLPAIKSEVETLNLEDFARRHFTTHKKGIFRRKIPLAHMIEWTNDSIPQPLIDNPNKTLNRNAINAFKILQRAMGDRAGSDHVKNTAAAYQPLVDLGISEAGLRDELYVQLCRQLSNNPDHESSLIGWEIMAVYTSWFPPSKQFEDYLTSFAANAFHTTTDPRIKSYVEAVIKRLKRIVRSGVRVKSPSLSEIERAALSPLTPAIFGETLEDIMRYEFAVTPTILPFLTESITKLNGLKREGIFRIGGDVEMVTELRLRTEKRKFNIEGIPDAAVPATLLRTWLSELSEPVVSAERYLEATRYADDTARCIDLVKRLPPVNQQVLFHLIGFLQKFVDPAVVAVTKVNVNGLANAFAPTLFRPPAEKPMDHTRLEQTFVRNLLLNLDCSAENAGQALAEPIFKD